VARDNYELLGWGYANFIRLSADLMGLNPTVYSGLRGANGKPVSQLRALDDLLATVTYRLKLTQNFGAADKKQIEQLQTHTKNISKQTTSQFSRHLQTRIYKALSQMLLQQHNYPALEKLVKENFVRFEKEGWFKKENHDLKLQMLTYLGNALYKNRKNKESLSYSEKLGEEITGFNKLHYDRYLFFYYNLRILNNAVLNPTVALKTLDEFEQLMRKKKKFYYDVFIYLNRAGVLYDMGRYKESLKSLVKLYVSDNYLKADKAFRFKVEVSELIVNYEAKDTDALLYRTGQVKKDYKAFASGKIYQRDFALIELLEQMANSKNVKRDEVLQRKVKSVLKLPVTEATEDSEIINYRDWLSRHVV